MAGFPGMSGAGGQSQWMMSGPVIQRQLNEMCQNLLNVRNGYRQMRDNLPYFVNPPGKAKARFIDITETLYGYLTQIRVSQWDDCGMIVSDKHFPLNQKRLIFFFISPGGLFCGYSLEAPQ